MPAASLLTVTEAARLCACHRQTILDAIARGELAALRLGKRGHFRIQRPDLYRWLRTSLTPAGSDRR